MSEASEITFEDVGKPPVRFTISIPVDQYEFLTRYAWDHRVSIATAIRQAIDGMRDEA